MTEQTETRLIATARALGYSIREHTILRPDGTEVIKSSNQYESYLRLAVDLRANYGVKVGVFRGEEYG